jgi:hypothetical protein
MNIETEFGELFFNFSEENATHTFSNPNLPGGALTALGFGSMW